MPSPGDKGTATAVVLDSHQHISGYLNVTPRQGDERMGTWASFRVHHNAQEGDRDVRTEEAGKELRFRSGRGACVRDSYTTVTAARYIELACLVHGSKASTVIIGAASPQAWASLSPVLQQAISAFVT
jgi:hypothetical protein